MTVVDCVIGFVALYIIFDQAYNIEEGIKDPHFRNVVYIAIGDILTSAATRLPFCSVTKETIKTLLIAFALLPIPMVTIVSGLAGYLEKQNQNVLGGCLIVLSLITVATRSSMTGLIGNYYLEQRQEERLGLLRNRRPVFDANRPVVFEMNE